jgi:hypothetical protein
MMTATSDELYQALLEAGSSPYRAKLAAQSLGDNEIKTGNINLQQLVSDVSSIKTDAFWIRIIGTGILGVLGWIVTKLI